MNGYQFTASLVQSIASLAWPAAIVVAVWLFRDKLTELLPLLRFRYKDLDVSFRLDQAEQEAAQLPPPRPAAEQPTPEERSRFEQIADLSPRAAILELRNDLEEAIRRFFERHADMDNRTNLPMVTMLRLMRKNGWIDAQTSALLDDLRAIGNNAAHSSTSQFSKSDALRFRALVEDVLPRLQT
jgi:hypothetical protein